MAGTGRAPKDKSERRNKTPPARGEWVDLEPLEAPVLPELPPCPLRNEDGDRLAWSERAVEAWERWRSDPVTQTYSPADVSYVIDLLALYEVMTPSSANEVRLRMDGLGLTPKGKRDLRLRIVEAGEDAPRRRSAGKGAADRRARLSVVK